MQLFSCRPNFPLLLCPLGCNPLLLEIQTMVHYNIATNRMSPKEGNEDDENLEANFSEGRLNALDRWVWKRDNITAIFKWMKGCHIERLHMLTKESKLQES